MHRHTQRLRTFGRRLFAALHQHISRVTACLRELDECAALGMQRMAELLYRSEK